MIASLRELFGRLRSLPASGLRRRRADGGFVTLVGAGPGAADLLTLGGLKALQEADVVLYDRLVGADVLALIPDHVQLEDVGKLTGQDHQQTQLRIGERLLTLAHAGQRVVRLKGGDPFIFGRGGEELAVLAAHDIPFAVLPGVTAALGCAAYAGIPLTHRDFAQQVTFVTAHCQRSIDRVDWAALGQSNHTVVFYMGVAQLPVIEQRLLAAGRRGETPIALIERGSTAQQRVILGRLSALAALGADQAVIAPSLVIVGEVAALGAELAWFTQPVLAASAAQDSAAA
jgi:uroporphyrin-III C-methyltransferase/precorrin-2 dehydrogenase/sirohydrochlorin ferrochelatase